MRPSCQHASTRLLLIGLVAAAFSLLETLIVSVAHAMWDTNGELVGVMAGAGRHRNVPDGTGGCFVVWTDARDGLQADIFAQRLDAFGEPLWAPGGMPVIEAANNQLLPHAVSDGAGGIIVAWHDQRVQANDLYAQRLNATGTRQWDPAGVPIATAPGLKIAHLPHGMVTDGAGGAILTWSDNRGVDQDIYAQRIDGSGAVQWGADGKAICDAADQQQFPVAAPDGGGGAIFAWEDRRAGDLEVFMQRVDSAGLDQWAADGEVIFELPLESSGLTIVPDGSGGAIVARADWFLGPDDGIRAQRVNSSGTVQWASGGVLVSDDLADQNFPALVPDGTSGAYCVWSDAGTLRARRVSATGTLLWPGSVALSGVGESASTHAVAPDGFGGVVATWVDDRGATEDIYMQRLDPDGASQWTAGGVPVCAAAGQQTDPAISADLGGTVFLTWEDRRAGFEVYAQIGFEDGLTGDFLCSLAGVGDVPEDQGGWVQLDVTAADADPNRVGVTGYNVWRLDPEPRQGATGTTPAASGVRGAASRRDARELLARATAAAGDRSFRLTPDLARAAGFPPGTWESVGFHAATQDAAYSLLAPTRDDFIGQGSTDETFVVSVHTNVPWAFTVSQPASGASVDNLAPGAPQNLAAMVQGSTVELAWDDNLESDLASYAVYRGTSPDFVPAVANRIGMPMESAFVDASPGADPHYKVSALDEHDNESSFSLAIPDGTVDTPAPVALSFLGRPSPSPFTTRTAAAFGLAEPGRVRLAVYDVSGRLVTTLLDERVGAGVHAWSWSGRDESGLEVARGVYFVRLTAPGIVATREVVFLE